MLLQQLVQTFISCVRGLAHISCVLELAWIVYTCSVLAVGCSTLTCFILFLGRASPLTGSGCIVQQQRGNPANCSQRAHRQSSEPMCIDPRILYQRDVDYESIPLDSMYPRYPSRLACQELETWRNLLKIVSDNCFALIYRGTWSLVLRKVLI